MKQLCKETPMVKTRPTMRAADGGESARFTGSFLASSFFWSQAFLYARPLSAANANRWAFKLLIRNLTDAV
jgi:hypothetical protein